MVRFCDSFLSFYSIQVPKMALVKVPKMIVTVKLNICLYRLLYLSLYKGIIKHIYMYRLLYLSLYKGIIKHIYMYRLLYLSLYKGIIKHIYMYRLLYLSLYKGIIKHIWPFHVINKLRNVLPNAGIIGRVLR